MLEFLFLILFCWLFFKAIVLCLKAAWGLTKILASILFALAVPALIGCLLFAGGTAASAARWHDGTCTSDAEKLYIRK